MLENFTLVISGPIKSRISLADLNIRFKYLRTLNSNFGLAIIISTYENEVPDWIDLKNFKLIINDDPGIDNYPSGPWPMGESKRNTSRMLKLTSSGINSVTTPFAIKTRIELLPDNDKFITLCDYFVAEVSIHKKSILVLREHHFGISNQSKPVLCWIPDTFQIMETQNLQSTWATANTLWLKYRETWHKKIRFPITNEQIIGLSYYKIFFNIPESIVINFHRYKFSRTLFQLNLLAEEKYIKLCRYLDSGLTISRLVKNSSFEKKRNKTKNIQETAQYWLNQNRYYFLLNRFYRIHTINKKKLVRVIFSKITFELKKYFSYFSKRKDQ